MINASVDTTSGNKSNKKYEIPTLMVSHSPKDTALLRTTFRDYIQHWLYDTVTIYESVKSTLFTCYKIFRKNIHKSMRIYFGNNH